MSEFTNAKTANFRWQLLVTVSAMALFGAVCKADDARASDDDSNRPTLWIELGGQLSRLDEPQEVFNPAIAGDRPSMFSLSQKFERLPLYSLDENAGLSFEPEGSDWVMSATIRYGRSGSNKHVHQQTVPASEPITHSGVPLPTSQAKPEQPLAARFADTKVDNDESHLIVDFQAGKDVGLGMFGGSATINLGVRFAQFDTKSTIALKSNPDFHFSNKYAYGYKIPRYQIYHSYDAGLKATRSFHGVGPLLSWNASTPVKGRPQNGELDFDWGVNAALLFGRQKAQVSHHATEQYHPKAKYAQRYTVTQYAITPPARERAVIVPNIGGFAGITYRIQNFKVSAGYRADLFFGAMDGGIDTARKENVGFYGPFASVSIGIGG